MLNKPVTLGRVVRSFSDSSHFAVVVEAGNLGTIRFESPQAPAFEVNNLVAFSQSTQPTSLWVATVGYSVYELCTRQHFGLYGVDEDQIFVVGAGMHLRPDPTFQVAATGSATNSRANGSMLVIPSYAGANPA